MIERGARTTEWRILGSDADASPEIEDDLFDEDEDEDEDEEAGDDRAATRG